MATELTLGHFKASLFRMLDEAFDNVQGMFLDKGTSLFETLDDISADVASRPVSGACASIAGQVDHTRIYLDRMISYARLENVEPIDWDTTWQTTSVSEEEWSALKAQLRQSYTELRAVLDDDATWESEYAVGGAMAVLAHTAYHLGEIRHSLCTVGR